jgi:hypothetical protein
MVYERRMLQRWFWSGYLDDIGARHEHKKCPLRAYISAIIVDLLSIMIDRFRAGRNVAFPIDDSVNSALSIHASSRTGGTRSRLGIPFALYGAIEAFRWIASERKVSQSALTTSRPMGAGRTALAANSGEGAGGGGSGAGGYGAVVTGGGVDNIDVNGGDGGTSGTGRSGVTQQVNDGDANGGHGGNASGVTPNGNGGVRVHG